MRFVADKHPLPRSLIRHPSGGGIVAECDIFPKRYGRIAAKLLVFKDTRSMRYFWRTALSKAELGKDCHGVVNTLGGHRISFRSGEESKPVMWGDARYFCIIGLCVPTLTMEVIAHESIHAGFSYEKRVRRNLFGKAAEFDEERIAYPAGIIAAAINRFLHNKKLYPERP